MKKGKERQRHSRLEDIRISATRRIKGPTNATQITLKYLGSKNSGLYIAPPSPLPQKNVGSIRPPFL